jgi:hypothetical protein
VPADVLLDARAERNGVHASDRTESQRPRSGKG